jgi:site-specific DNA recombinase
MTKRAILYLRQSVAREDSISLELQESAGRDHCARMGYEVLRVEADPGISGRTWKRPAVVRVMNAIEAREADVIVLWKWSRLSRSRLDWAVAADRVQSAGGSIESATEPLDTSTSTGRLARGMMTEFAAFESERIGDVWKESHARRIKAGLPANGKPRFGYAYTSADGFTIDPVTGPILGRTYRSYIAGNSVYALVRQLNDGDTRPVRGYGVVTDGLWSDRTLRRVMDSGFAAGFISFRGELLPGAHEAIIEPEEWDAFKEARERRRVYRRVERSEYLLSGMVRCICGSAMTAGQFGTSGTAKYRCKAGHEKRTHAGGYVTASLVEEAVLTWLREWRAELDAAAKLAPAVRRGAPDPSAKIAQQITVIDGKIDRLGMRLVDSAIPFDSYTRILATLTQEKASLESARVTAAVHSRRSQVSAIPALLDNWADLDIPVRREILRSLIDYVEVTPGRPRGTFVIHQFE